MDQDVLHINGEIELRHLRYFVAVAEELHFGRAAERLHLAQPPLSQQIRRLEEILGLRLFARTSRSVKLTPAGTAYLERARRTLAGVARDVEETRRIGRGEVGTLHVGFVGSAMLTRLPAVFGRFREANPKVSLHLHESFTSRVVEGLESGELDAGILRDGDPAEGIVTETIFSEGFVAVLPVGHRCAGQRTISPAALQGEPLVYYPRSAGARAYERPLAIFEEYGFRPQVAQEAGHWLTILRLVGAGLGVSVAPACVRWLGSPDVVCVPLRGAKARSMVELAFRVGETRATVARFAAMARGAGARKG
jgi:DNA-binding transcriptional LysR family regulator